MSRPYVVPVLTAGCTQVVSVITARLLTDCHKSSGCRANLHLSAATVTMLMICVTSAVGLSGAYLHQMGPDHPSQSSNKKSGPDRSRRQDVVWHHLTQPKHAATEESPEGGIPLWANLGALTPRKRGHEVRTLSARDAEWCVLRLAPFVTYNQAHRPKV